MTSASAFAKRSRLFRVRGAVGGPVRGSKHHLGSVAGQPRWHSALWILACTLLVAATQVGSLEQEFYTDEATFTVVAGHLLDGHLPYVDVFDVKPPMVYFLLAGAMAVFGEHLPVVRALGDLCVLMSAIAVFAIARRLTDTVSAGLAALLLVAMYATPDGFPTLTEQPAMAMLMWALWLLIARRERWWGVAGAGLLVSLAVLTRANLGFVAVALFGWLLAAPPRMSKAAWRDAALFAAAGALPAAGFVLLYWNADALAALRLGAVDVALAYAGEFNWWRTLAGHARMALAVPRESLLLLPFLATLAVGMAAAVADHAAHAQRRAEHVLLWLVLAAVLASIAASGSFFLHYWQQLHPIGAVFCAYGIAWLGARAPWRWMGCLLPGVAVVAALAQTAPAAFRLASQIGQPVEESAWRPLKAAANAIEAELRPGETIYAFDGQLIYWYLDMTPVSPFVHPSNLRKERLHPPLVDAGYLAEDEFRRILERRPTYLVSGREATKHGWLPREGAEALRNLLETSYRLIHDDARRRLRVYKLRSTPATVADPPAASRSQLPEPGRALEADSSA